MRRTWDESSWAPKGHPSKTERSPATMIALHDCPRCNGAVLEYPAPADDGRLCINCGWRKADINPDIQAQVQAHLGKRYMEGRYTHNRIGTGKPPLNGWERVKRRRERERARMAENGSEGGAALVEGPSAAAM